MGFYLPSEVSRLVLSYLLDHDLQDTSAQFLEECPFLQELRQVAAEDLADYTRVNGRSLMEILREYKQLIKTISGEYKQVNPNNNFEAPQRMLDLLLEQRRAPVQGQKSSKKVVQPIRPKPAPSLTPSIQISPHVRKPLRSSQASSIQVSPGAATTTFAGLAQVSPTPIHNITINLPPVAPKAKSPSIKAQATSAATTESPTKNLVINTEENTLDDVPDHPDQEPVSSTFKPRSSTNSQGKTGSRKGKRPIRRGTHEKSKEQTDDEFLAELLGKPIAEMLDESVMMTKGQDQQKAISDVAANMLTPSLLDKLVDVVDLDQLPRPKDSALSPDSPEIGAEPESRLSTPELCKSTEDNTEETSNNVTTPATILSSLPQTPLPLSELDGTSSLSCAPPVFVMSPPSRASISNSTAVSSSSTSTSQSITSSTPSSLVFLQSSTDNTITLTPGTVQYDQFAAALEKIPSVDNPTPAQVQTKKEDPLAQLISATIINSPTKASQASAELDLTNVPIEIVGGQPAQSSLKSAPKSRKRKISTPKHLGAGKKSKSGNELQAVIGGAATQTQAKPAASKKTANISQANSMLEKVATLSKTKGPLGKENVTALLPPKENVGPKMLVLTPITREEIQRKELAKRKSQLAAKKEKSPRPMPPSPHVRNLIFSPPKSETPTIVPSNLKGSAVNSTNLKTPEKNIETAGGVKMLSPRPSASPLRRTDSSWNREIKIMFQEQSQDSTDTVLNDPHVPLPTSPVPLSEISITPTMTSQPPVEALTKSLVSSNVSAVSPFVSRSVPEMTSCVTPTASQVTPTIRQSSPGMIPQLQATPSRVSAKTAEPTPQVIPRKIIIPISMPGAPQPTTPTGAKVTSSKKVSDKKRLVASSKKDRSPPLKPSWDERMRSSLGAAETNMDHIAKRYSESSPGRRRRSPRKKRKPKSSPSNVFSDEDESPPEIQLEDGQNISPESQKIIDFIGTSLLESLEKNEADSSDSDDDDDEDDNPHEEDKLASDNRGLTDMPILANSPNKTLHKQATKTLNRAIASMVATTKKPLKNANKNNETVDNLEKNLEASENVTEICQAEPSVKDGGKSDSDILMHTIKPETTIDLLTQPVVSPNPDDAKFKTPQKTDVFAFKTPRKSPLLPRFEDSPRKMSTRKLSPDKAPHIPVSPLHLLSPVQGKRAIPLTPSRSNKKRQESTLDTPVLQSPGSSPGPAYNLAPTTPRGNKTPSAPYYTPSPSTRDSFPSPAARPGDAAATPGLKFLLEEGQKLSSQSEDSMSPAKAKAAGKSCRKSFRNMFKKSSAEGELGSLLEKQISRYPFDQEENNYATFKSPDAGGQRSDYTSSPHIVLRPSSTQASPSQAVAADGNLEKSFVSPNRTCYLSPTAMAMSSSFLGIDYNAPPETAFPSSEGSNAQHTVALEEPAPQPTIVMEEATEAQSSILELVYSDKDEPNAVSGPSGQSTDFAHLSDTEQSASADCSKVKKVDPPSEGNNKIDFPDLNLSEDSNSGDDEGEGTSNMSEINRKGNTFIEAFQEVKKKEKDSAIKVTKIDVKKPAVKWSPRKPRRLTLTALKSSERLQTLSLTNDCVPFEAQFDVHNLDKLQTSVQNYSEDTSSSMDSQFESPLKTSPKKKSASPKKVPPSPKLTVKITSKKMDEKRKSAEKLRKRLAKKDEKNERKQVSPETAGEGNKTKLVLQKSDGNSRKGNERIVKDKVNKVDSKKNRENVDKADEKVAVKGDKKVKNIETKEEEILEKKAQNNVKNEKVPLENNETVMDKINTRKSKRTDTKKTDEELKVNRGNGKKAEVLSDNKTDLIPNKSDDDNKESSTKNRRGRSLDKADDNLSLRPRRGNSSDNQLQESAKKPKNPKSTKNTEPKAVIEKLDMTESSAAKPKQTVPKSNKTVAIKNPPSKYAEENLVKLNQELTLQFSPRKSSPVPKEPPSMDQPSAEPDIRTALGLVRTSKRKAEDPPTLPEKKTKVMPGIEEVVRNVKNVRVNKHGREITPLRLPSQYEASSSTVTKGLSPNFGVDSPPRTRKALASYSPKKARKDEVTPYSPVKARKDPQLTQEQSKVSSVEVKGDLLPVSQSEKSKGFRGKKEDLVPASQGELSIKEMPQEQSKSSRLGRKGDLLPVSQEKSEASSLGKKENLLSASRCQEPSKGPSLVKMDDLLPNKQCDLSSKRMPRDQSKSSCLGKKVDVLPASQEQSKGLRQEKKEDLPPKQAANIAVKKPDLITKHTANIMKEDKNVSFKNLLETSMSPSRIDSSEGSSGTPLLAPSSLSVDVLAQRAMEIMNRINSVGNKEGLIEGELNKPAQASNVQVDNLPGDSEKEAGEQGNESPQCTLQDDSYSELQMSELFIFQTNLPFGVFEDELE